MSKKWTAADIPDQSDRTALITGANSGIGFHTASALAGSGATVLMACRSPDKGAKALDSVRADHPLAQVELIQLDLADLSSIEAAVEQITAREKPLDLLINNAGVMALPELRTADGFEMQFGTNHLGHFGLTGRLLPKLLRADAPRVVTVSSLMHRRGQIDFGDLQGEAGYDRWKAYSQSKLANLVFTYELDRRAKAVGVELTAVAAHPGYSSTGLQWSGAAAGGNKLEGIAMQIGNRLIAQSDKAGALPTLRAATDPAVESADYYGPGGLNETRGAPTKVRPASRALEEATATSLWSVSEELTGVTYDALS